MRKSIIARCLAATAIGLVGHAAAADETKSTYVDATATAGYSTDPFLETSSGGGTAFASLAARLNHRWISERTTTEVAGYWEGSEYFNYRLENIASLRADTRHSLNERLDVSASGLFVADFDGQLSNRFVDVVPPTQPQTGPVVTGPPPDLFFYGGNQLRGEGDIGFDWRATESSQLFGRMGLTRAHFSRSGLRDHTSEFLSAGYQRTLSQRTDVGFQVTASGTQFDGSNDSNLIVDPQATLRTHLSEYWTLAGALGLTFSKVRHAGIDHTATDPSFSATLCHQAMTGSLCATAAHYVQSSGVAELATTTAAGLNWIEEIDNKQTVQLSAGYEHFSNAQALAINAIQRNQYHAAAVYTRQLSDRFSIGAEAAARGVSGGGINKQSDVSASVFLRFHWGNLG